MHRRGQLGDGLDGRLEPRDLGACGSRVPVALGLGADVRDGGLLNFVSLSGKVRHASDGVADVPCVRRWGAVELVFDGAADSFVVFVGGAHLYASCLCCVLIVLMWSGLLFFKYKQNQHPHIYIQKTQLIISTFPKATKPMPPTLYEQTIDESIRVSYPLLIAGGEAEQQAEVYMKQLINDWQKTHEEMQCEPTNLRLVGAGASTNRTFLLSQRNVEGTFCSGLPRCLHRFNRHGELMSVGTRLRTRDADTGIVKYEYDFWLQPGPYGAPTLP